MSDEFERRMKMIEALEETKDDALLSDLVEADTRLQSYYYVLSRACSHLKDPLTVEKLLDLSVLDKSAVVYKDTIGHVFATIAANEKNPDPKVVSLLFERIKDDQDIKNRSLCFIFSTVTSHGPDHPNVALAKLLIKNGANLESAVTPQEQVLEGIKNTVQRQLDSLSKFKAIVFGP